MQVISKSEYFILECLAALAIVVGCAVFLAVAYAYGWTELPH